MEDMWEGFFVYDYLVDLSLFCEKCEDKKNWVLKLIIFKLFFMMMREVKKMLKNLIRF